MEYRGLQYHYRPKSGWINDPNGLVFFNGYYHVFFQHTPNAETPADAMHWGHARTKDFLHWEPLPIALFPTDSYDCGGCWSGTAIVKDDILYLFYASVCSGYGKPNGTQTVSIAYSRDGIHFEKYEKNPVISRFPADGGPDFRDPALCCIDGIYYCVMATGHPETKTGRLLLYRSENLLEWEYRGILYQWENCIYTECPSFLPAENGKFLLTVSVCPLEQRHYFCVLYGSFSDGKFTVAHIAQPDKGPDQYAGQVFRDHLGRNILISWMPGWEYAGYTDHDVGCMSIPRQLTLTDGVVRAYPAEEVQHLLRDSDPCLLRTEDGFIVRRTNREPLVYKGEIRELKILRDAYIAEIFVNGGEEVYSVLL